MAVPDFQSFFKPLSELAGDGEEHSVREAREVIANRMNLSEAELSELLLGLDVIYLQAKRWEGTVGRPEIQRFVGALHGKRARKGVFITTGRFSEDAIDYVNNIEPKVSLIDGRNLANLMIDCNLGTTTAASYELKRIDSDYFGEE